MDDFDNPEADPMEARLAALETQLGMLMTCVKAISEGRKVVIHDNGNIFVQAPAIIGGVN